MTHAHLTDEERAAIETVRGSAKTFTEEVLLAIIDRLAAAPAEAVHRPTTAQELAAVLALPAQDAPEEAAEIQKRLECHYALEAFPDGAMLDDIATLLRLLKQRRLVTRERLAEIVRPFVDQFDGNATTRKYLCADALLSADLGFKVVGEVEIETLVNEVAISMPVGESLGKNVARAILRLFDGSAK